MSERNANRSKGPLPTAALVGVGVGLVWSLWPTLLGMAQRWSQDARYSHGWLVPLFAIALLWMRREQRPTLSERSPSPWGLLLVGLGAVSQSLGGYLGSTWLTGLAVIPYLAGAAVLWGGRRELVWALPSILFLAFMVPLPWRLETALGPPLQTIATKLSTYALQSIGLMAFAQGYIIRLGEHQIGVVEACSGLSMLMTFLALATGAALVSRRPLLDRLLLVAASVPVALAANTARIVLTGLLYEKAGSGAAEVFYHDLAGWLMIPLALLLLWGLATLWSWIIVLETGGEREAPTVVGMPGMAVPSGAPPIEVGRSRKRGRSGSINDKRRREPPAYFGPKTGGSRP
jgi:exosortase